MMDRRVFLFFSVAAVALARGAGASTVAATSCSDTSVQSAVNTAAAGDVVVVPEGNCTWSTPVVIAGKRITLSGAGIGRTNVTDNCGPNNPALQISRSSGSNFVRVNGFTFIKQTANTDGIVRILGEDTTGASSGVGFRFDHDRLFDNAVAGGRGLVVSHVYGLIDHNTIDVADTAGSDQMITIFGSDSGSDGGYTPWEQPLSLGSANAVYVEDNTFTYANQNEDCIDGSGGARVVVRHNIFNNISQGFHGTDTGSRRSVFSLEIYRNTYLNNSSRYLRAATIRGGTALVFDNTYGGSHSAWFGVNLLLYRASIGGPYSWNYCDGTNWDIGSTDFSANASRTTVRANSVARFDSTHPDTVCTDGPGCTRFFDGLGTRGYPCRDQPGRTHDQVLAPIYAWGNSGGGVGIVAYDDGCSQCGGVPLSNWLAANRDYYNDQGDTFDGTGGVGRGTSAMRPRTCTPQVAYFATDAGPSGTLYQCTATDTWSVYYTPYPYPHPAGAPDAPTNLRIVR
jgi:hypothetical protein